MIVVTTREKLLEIDPVLDIVMIQRRRYIAKPGHEADLNLARHDLTALKVSYLNTSNVDALLRLRNEIRSKFFLMVSHATEWHHVGDLFRWPIDDPSKLRPDHIQLDHLRRSWQEATAQR